MKMFTGGTVFYKGLRFEVSGFGFRVSGFGFRVSGLEFGVNMFPRMTSS